MTSGEPRDSRDQVVRWLEDGQRQMSALLGLVHENERLRERVETAEQLIEAQTEIERHNKEREEVAERLTELTNEILMRLRPKSKVAEAA